MRGVPHAEVMALDGTGVAFTDGGQADAHAFLIFSKVVGGAEVELVPAHAFERLF